MNAQEIHEKGHAGPSYQAIINNSTNGPRYADSS